MCARRTIASWVDELQSSGSYVFTLKDAEVALGGTPVAIQSALRRLKQKGRIVAPRRGYYVVVPLEYRASGSPPASWFIDDLMDHLGRDYYVAILTAAAIHGAGHQQPMAFQVVADRPIRPMKAGRVRIDVHASRTVTKMATTTVQTETGTMAVGTPETTSFDLVRFPDAAGHWDNIATVLSELAETLDPAVLLQNAPLVRLPDVQRLGYLLALAGHEELAMPLAKWLAGRRSTVVRLRTDRPAGDSAPDPRWRLIPNETIEVEL